MALNPHGEERQQRPPQSELCLIDFETYEDYLDSLYNDYDRCYLQSQNMCRKIAECGYRRDGQTYSQEEFKKLRKKAVAYFTPLPPNILSSTGFRFGDLAQNALAIRERANRVGLLTTIIFIKYSYTTTKGREISGYIDFAHSLLCRSWNGFFKKNKPIYPNKTDLGYYDWKKGKSIINDSLYLKTLMSPTRGLIFQHKMDRMLIQPNPYSTEPGQHTTRVRFDSSMYNIFVLIDHTLRARK